jgi:hypothetical protein
MHFHTLIIYGTMDSRNGLELDVIAHMAESVDWWNFVGGVRKNSKGEL